ncbi:hypothetical protein Verru16b_00013 [Lacunisphaera limnophila]|uniref:TonB C-terminal domain-containing protein n=1 Tax=Lacunisphaera limnophila TaxID=1838286 RepID=A0A1I7PHA4_9BACT|nr:hypothetical protein [Lacunisphaera limnophila]AOS42978.1 hypothetical protein Verru16b_00013 [Lacunisphaera limnophila]
MRLTLPRLTWALALSSALLAPAKIEDWKDPQGNVFKAEPAEALGPFALFRTPTGGGRRLPWRALSQEDCVRFHEQTGTKPERADRWADATGQLTGRLRGYLRQYEEVTLVPVDLRTLPEPEILIVFIVENSASGSWDMSTQSIPLFKDLQAKHPGEVAGIQYGVNHGAQEHGDMNMRSNVPWPMVDYEEQRRIPALFRLSPKMGDFALFALSRDGVPIFGVSNPDAAAVTQFFTDAHALLGLLHPANPKGWAERAHYLSALHASRHRTDAAGPVLVGDPLVPKGLSDRGIYRVEAKIEVGADGKVTAVTLKEDAAIPAEMAPALAKALQRSAVFVPAVNQGVFVPGTYDYLKEVPR